MSEVRKRLESMGIRLPKVTAPVASYVPYVVSGNLVFVSGVLPFEDGELLFTGRVGQKVSFEQAQAAARRCATNLIASLEAAAGDLDDVKRIVRLEGYVASEPGFTDQHKVVNAASELVAEVFGERGVHSRIAVGVAAIPLGAPVEISAIAEI